MELDQSHTEERKSSNSLWGGFLNVTETADDHMKEIIEERDGQVEDEVDSIGEKGSGSWYCRRNMFLEVKKKTTTKKKMK